MTISNTNRSVTAQGNGATTEWPFTFNIPTAEGVNVVTTVVATGVQTVIDSADYTVTGLGTDNSGEIVYPTVASGNPPLTSATEITIFRNVPKTQTVNIGNQTRYDAGVVEDVWDKLTMMAQDLSGEGGLNLHYPTGDTAATELPASGARATKVIAFDASGNVIVSSSSISEIESGAVDAAASAVAALVSENAAAADLVLTNADVVTTSTSETNAANSAASAEAAAAGIKWKDSVKASTTVNITLSGAQTIDTISLIADDLCLVQFQTAPAENGLYVVSVGVWTRSTQMNTWLQIPGAAVAIEEGAVWADSQRICTSDQGGTIGVTAITWGPIGGDVTATSTTTFTNKTIDADATGNVLSNIDIGNAIAASQAEAEAGTDNTKLLTALRVAQAIAALSSGGATAVISRGAFTAASTVSLTGFNPSLYDAYEIKLHLTVSLANTHINMRTSTDGGSNYDSGGSDYAYSADAGLSSGGGPTADVSNGASEIRLTSVDNIGAGLLGSFDVSMIRPDAAIETAIVWSSTHSNTGSRWLNARGSAVRLSATDVDAVQFAPSTGTVTGTITFIGIKKA